MKPPRDPRTGRQELSRALARSRAILVAAFVFSLFVNLLMLTGPLYMLQIYDRVIGSRSEETLVALTLLVAFLFLMMGILDHARGRILARVGARFQSELDPRVFLALLRQSARLPGVGLSAALKDLEAVQRLLSSPALLALFDIPWTPIFLVAIFVFHPMLGYLAVIGGAILVVVTILNQRLTAGPGAEAAGAALSADRLAEEFRADAEEVLGLGMGRTALARWQRARGKALAGQIRSSDIGGAMSATTKTFRLFLQSAMLGLGAWLVLKGELSPGAMIAGSILLGRALAPVDLAIAQWPTAQRAMIGWRNLSQILSLVPEEKPRTALPRPQARVEVHQLTVIPPGEPQASLRMVSFTLEPGTALGVIGPSGAGKSTLARALVGYWPAAGGRIRLDGASLDQYDPDVLGRTIGYLPQRISLFDGTVAENIARLDPEPDADKVIAAAKKADAHEMILRLPEGYDTPVQGAATRLSGGQIQRIGLARALYDDPVLLVLDEPNSNLDNDGSLALNNAVRAIKAAGGAVVIMAHRPAAIHECDYLLYLDGGIRQAFGPREDVLRDVLRNSDEVLRSRGQGGVT
ncbi:MAG: type I secretion system permease/ATPase [Alphaproteobacteria bacterium]|nr:MAG: type I secretion system permease/ATPase [Alphaproteobacteria bacterium]